MTGRSLIIALATALWASTAAAQMIDFGKYPDLTGQWKRPPGVGISWDPSKPSGLGQQAPLIPEYKAMLEASIKDQLEGGQGLDTRVTCITNGMPRIMTFIRPVEFIILPKVTYIHYENIMPRRIYTDGRDWPKDEEPTFVGYSIGKWIDEDGDGKYDVLEVETATSRVRARWKPPGFPSISTTRRSSRSGSISTRPTRTCFTTRSRSSIMRSRARGR
jgi:hypothetical protein